MFGEATGIPGCLRGLSAPWGLASLVQDQLAWDGSPVRGIISAFPAFPRLGLEAEDRWLSLLRVWRHFPELTFLHITTHIFTPL